MTTGVLSEGSEVQISKEKSPQKEKLSMSSTRDNWEELKWLQMQSLWHATQSQGKRDKRNPLPPSERGNTQCRDVQVDLHTATSFFQLCQLPREQISGCKGKLQCKRYRIPEQLQFMEKGAAR